MKYNVGDKVLIKSIDWYNENRDKDGNIPLIDNTSSKYNFIKIKRGFCGKVMTISRVNIYSYNMVEDDCKYFWTDEMIEGLVEEEEIEFTEEDKYWCDIMSESDPTTYILPQGYQFVDENGNVINATKIVLEKKKKEYPKTYEECYQITGLSKTSDIYGYKNGLLFEFQKLLIAHDAYWKLYGEEMGLGKPWEPNLNIRGYYAIARSYGNVVKTSNYNCDLTFVFPTAEMRDAFYENFKVEIESCKELL